MKMLISLSSYGSKNLHLLNRCVDEYKSYKKYDVDIEVHCTVPLERADISQVVHSNVPTTCLFHREDFIHRKSDYDLFLFAEYDILIKECAIDTYLAYDSLLPSDYCIGFLRYETTSENVLYLIDSWLNIPGYSYISSKCLNIDGRNYFSLSNPHQGCYVLTKAKLQHVINNSQFSFNSLNGLGVESASSTIFHDWSLGPRGIMKKVYPTSEQELTTLLIHHTPDCHVNPPGVYGINPFKYRNDSVTLDKLFLDLNLNTTT